MPTALDFFIWNLVTNISCLTAFTILPDKETFIHLLNDKEL